MGKIDKLYKTAKLAKQIATVQKSINNCPVCREHQNAIKKHCMEGHPTENTKM